MLLSGPHVDALWCIVAADCLSVSTMRSRVSCINLEHLDMCNSGLLCNEQWPTVTHAICNLQRKDSVADSTVSASAPKKIKLSVKLTAPADQAQAAAATPLDQRYAESSAAAVNRPRAFEPSDAEPERPGPSEFSKAPGRARESEPRAVAPGPKASEQPARAAGRSRLSEPSRPAPNRPSPQGLPMVAAHPPTEQQDAFSFGGTGPSDTGPCAFDFSCGSLRAHVTEVECIRAA